MDAKQVSSYQPDGCLPIQVSDYLKLLKPESCLFTYIGKDVKVDSTEKW